ncbi:hypothetical protein, partial [Mycobacterium sp. 1482292.6]|uniref:hypothetical protein n=1 Tax=Mycobacterium sp. 1482292.6 TaxID=1834081 RepID=UPI000B278AF4
IYTDGDNPARDLHGLRDLLQAPGFAMHDAGHFHLTNSAFVAARNHPVIDLYLKTLESNYGLRQDELNPEEWLVPNTRGVHSYFYVKNPSGRIRRRSVMERTGSDAFLSALENAGFVGPALELIPRISVAQLPRENPDSWASSAPRPSAPEQTVDVLQHAVTGLIRDLGNRRGDLNLLAVAPLIEGLPDPAAGW